MRFLIVDDDLAVRKILEVWLRSYGECTVVDDGNKAVNEVKSSFSIDGVDKIDLICLDIMMPNTNGLEALKEIREIEEQNGVCAGHGAKVIMTSAASNPQTIMGAFNSQCEAYLIKPLEKEKLFSTIESVGLTLS